MLCCDVLYFVILCDHAWYGKEYGVVSSVVWYCRVWDSVVRVGIIWWCEVGYGMMSNLMVGMARRWLA